MSRTSDTVDGTTSGSRAIRRATSSRNDGPSCHQWPNSSASNGAHTTPIRPVRAPCIISRALTSSQKCWAWLRTASPTSPGRYRCLSPSIGLGRGHPPVPQAPQPVPLVELEVPRVSGVPDSAAPDLLRDLGAAPEDRQRQEPSPLHQRVRLELAVPGPQHVPLRLQRVHRHRLSAGDGGLGARVPDQMGVDEEEPDALLREQRPGAGHLAGEAVDRRRPPGRRRTVGALRQPDPARPEPEVALARGEAGPDLRPSARVVQDQRVVPVGRVGREDLESARPSRGRRTARRGPGRPAGTRPRAAGTDRPIRGRGPRARCRRRRRTPRRRRARAARARPGTGRARRGTGRSRAARAGSG